MSNVHSDALAGDVPVFRLSSGVAGGRLTMGEIRVFDRVSSPLPPNRNPWIFMAEVPDMFLNSTLCNIIDCDHISEIRVFRNNGSRKRGIFLKFKNQNVADWFFLRFNLKKLPLLEETWDFVREVRCEFQEAMRTRCQLCQERLEDNLGIFFTHCNHPFHCKDNVGIFFTHCNHPFHCNCISNLEDDIYCPACRSEQYVLPYMASICLKIARLVARSKVFATTLAATLGDCANLGIQILNVFEALL